MNQLTRINQFVIDETLMQKVFEACGYQFMVVTLNNDEPHFFSKEVSDGLRYTKPSSFVKYFERHDLATLTLTKSNGLNELKTLFKEFQLSDRRFLSPIKKQARHASLIPSSSLQEYLIRYAKRPEAMELGKKLLEVLNSSYIIQPTMIDEPLDEVEQLLRKIAPTHSEPVEVSKEIQNLFKSFVGVDPGYFNWYPSFRKEPVYG